MVWFKVDDGFYDHPKVKNLPRGGIRKGAIFLWNQAGSWCARYLTDGLIPATQIEEFGATRKDAHALVAAGLWHDGTQRDDDCQTCLWVPPKHYVFHQWAEYQLTKAQVEAEREAARKRQAKYRHGNGQQTDE